MTTQVQPNVTLNPFLRRVLLADVALEAALGVACIAAAQPIAALTGMDATLVSVFGVFALIAAALVAYIYSAPTRTLLWALMEVNAIGAVLLAVVTLAGMMPLTSGGVVVMLVVAADFAILAALEWVGLRKQ